MKRRKKKTPPRTATGKFRKRKKAKKSRKGRKR